MTQPYFLPDPQIPDADTLGYGDLIFGDGKTIRIDNDPETAAMLPRQNVDQPPPANPMAPVPIPGTSHSLDPSTGNIMSSTPDQVSQYLQQSEPQPPGPPGEHAAPEARRQGDLQSQMDQMSGTQPPDAGSAPGSPPQMQPVPIPGTDHALDSTGKIVPASQVQGAAGYGTGGLQLAEREGALPPGVAAQQAQERQASDQSVMQATAYSRQQEAETYRQAALKRQGELDAEKKAQEDAVKEQQAKLQRLQSEQELESKVDIKTDLVSAEGGFGAVLSVMGAALLGAVHSDAGLRMIENTIDRNVKTQIGQRDSKLRVFADQIGSTQQAIATGKAQLYKIAADKVEQTIQLTKADVFEAQTPAILAGLRAQQQRYDQEKQAASLGKPIEKAPVAEKVTPAEVQGYGKAENTVEIARQHALAAARSIGLAGFDDKTGQFKNREEVIKNGIPGMGKIDQLAKDLGELPGVGHIVTAADNLATSKQGMDVRNALTQMINDRAAQDNPGQRITDVHIKLARQELGLQTEEGVVQAIEKMLRETPEAQARNVATYGKGAASQYENQLNQSDPNRPHTGESPDMGTPAQPGSARQQLQEDMQRPAAQGAQGKLDPIREVAGDVQTVAGRDLPPEGLKILVAQAAHETGDGQHAPNNNMFGHKASGGRPGAELMTTEGEGANARQVKQNFAVYPTIADAVAEHVDLLKRRYPEAWKALEVGDAPAYVAALKDAGYFTGSETAYLNGIQRRL